MNIRIGNYRLTAGTNDFVISEVKINQTEKNKGQEYDADSQYFPTIDSALNSVLRRRLLKSDATTLGDLLTEFKSYRMELQGLFKGIG